MAATPGALTSIIEGLWSARVNEPGFLPGLELAPPKTATSGRYEYQAADYDGRPDTDDLGITTPMGIADAHSELQFAHKTLQGSTIRLDAGAVKLPQQLIDQLNSGNGYMDLEAQAQARILSIATWQHSQRLRARIDASSISAPSAGTLVLTSPGFDLASYIDETIDEIVLSGGRAPNVFYASSDTIRRMLTNDTIFGQGGLSVGPAVPGVERRTGHATRGALEAFFASRGLRLIEDSNQQRSSVGGTVTYAWSGRACIAYAAPYDGFAFTALERGQAESMLAVTARELAYPQPVGIGLTADCKFEVEVADAALARFATVTL